MRHTIVAIPRPARWRGGRGDAFDREKTVIFTQVLKIAPSIAEVFLGTFFSCLLELLIIQDQ